ncbi:MAG: ABC transporter family substrate-binding protein [Terrimesophilobacter sp.]
MVAGVIVAIVVTGCTAPTVVEGSTVTVATGAALFSLNDRTSYGNSVANSGVLQALNSSFNRYDSESALALDSSFGTYQLVSNDPLTVKYTIARDVTWSDGVPVDAADLLLAWVANSGARNSMGVNDAGYRNPETGQYATPFPTDVVYFDGTTSEGLQYVTKLPEISDEGRSLTLTWDSYIVDWPLLLQVGLPAHVVAAHALDMSLRPDSHSDDGNVDAKRLADAQKAKEAVIDAVRKNDTSALSAIANFWNSGFDLEEMPEDASILVSTGPYTITGFVPGESVTLSANSRYRGDHNPVFETVTVRFIVEPLDQIAALNNGTVDVIVPKANSETINAIAETNSATILMVPGGTYEHLDLSFANGKSGTFQDARVREAFLRTVPVQQIKDEVLGAPLADTSERSSLVFPPGSTDYAEAVAANDSARFRTPDVERAKALLVEAGVTNPVVCMMFDPSNPKRVKEYQLIVDAAAFAGFVVTNCSGPDWRNLLGTPGTYDAALFGWSSSNDSVAGLQSLFASGARGNLNGYSNSEVDTLLSQLAVTPDIKEQRILRLALDSLLYSDSYGLPLYQDTIVVAHNDELTGVRPATLAKGILWNIWEWAPASTSSVQTPPVK